MMGNNFPATQAVGGKSVKFDAGKFQWLGTIAPVVETMAVWHTTGVKTVDDLRKRETVAGASGRGAITYFYPTMMNEFLGTKFKIVTGYPGGNQINLAMERGEVEARNNTWSSWKATRPQWLKDKLIIVVAQAGPRAPDLDAPSVEELARTPDDRLTIELIVSGTQLGRPFATTPGRAGGPARRAARRLPRHHEGSRIPQGRGADELRGRSGLRRADAEDRRKGSEHAEASRRARQGVPGVNA